MARESGEIVLAPRDGNTPHELLKNAELALYRAKKAGPGTVRFFEVSLFVGKFSALQQGTLTVLHGKKQSTEAGARSISGESTAS